MDFHLKPRRVAWRSLFASNSPIRQTNGKVTINFERDEMSPEREKQLQIIKEVGTYCTLAIWAVGLIAVFHFHQSGWWLMLALIIGWALYYPFIRGYIERKYFSE